jgi:hypothetical protein
MDRGCCVVRGGASLGESAFLLLMFNVRWLWRVCLEVHSCRVGDRVHRCTPGAVIHRLITAGPSLRPATSSAGLAVPGTR